MCPWHVKVANQIIGWVCTARLIVTLLSQSTAWSDDRLHHFSLYLQSHKCRSCVKNRKQWRQKLQNASRPHFRSYMKNDPATVGNIPHIAQISTSPRHNFLVLYTVRCVHIKSDKNIIICTAPVGYMSLANKGHIETVPIVTVLAFRQYHSSIFNMHRLFSWAERQPYDSEFQREGALVLQFSPSTLAPRRPMAYTSFWPMHFWRCIEIGNGDRRHFVFGHVGRVELFFKRRFMSALYCHPLFYFCSINLAFIFIKPLTFRCTVSGRA